MFSSHRLVVGGGREGQEYLVRPFNGSDAPALETYFKQLPGRSRYDRFLGAMQSPVAAELRKLALPGSVRSLVAVRGNGQIIGEARYAMDDAGGAVEMALSVASDERGAGVGSSLLGEIERYAARAGAATIFGDTLRTNERMLDLAKRRGFRLGHSPGDWTLVRFEKCVLDPYWILPVAQGAIAADSPR